MIACFISNHSREDDNIEVQGPYLRIVSRSTKYLTQSCISTLKVETASTGDLTQYCKSTLTVETVSKILSYSSPIKHRMRINLDKEGINLEDL